MIRLGAAGLLLALAACGRERPDPRLAELTTPVHVTVRVIDAPVERVCEGSTFQQVSCLITRAERQGCVYLELGAAADAPVKGKQLDVRRCDLVGLEPSRLLLENSPGKKATLYVDSRAERVLVDLADSVHAIYVRKGEAVIDRRLWAGPGTRPPTLMNPDGTLNWVHVPPLLAVLDVKQLRDLGEKELDELLARTPGGKVALMDSLVSLAGAGDAKGAWWDLAITRLDAAQRAELREAMLLYVTDGLEGALDWFLAHPEEQRPDFLDALEQAMANETYEVTYLLPVLLHLDPKRAEVAACEHLERQWHLNSGEGSEYNDDMAPETASLAVLASRRSKCPWVLPLLQRNPCAVELRCDQDPDDRKQTPLCTPSQSARAMKRALMLPNEELSDEDLREAEYEYDWGALLIAAALVQGPLPPDFALADARRLYSVPGKEDEDEDEVHDLCRAYYEEPGDWACRLPPSITTSINEGCRLVLDDTKKTMKLTPLPRRE